jgi:hypothetical protein
VVPTNRLSLGVDILWKLLCMDRTNFFPPALTGRAACATKSTPLPFINIVAAGLALL